MRFELLKKLLRRRQVRDRLLDLFEMTTGQLGAQRVPAAALAGPHPDQTHRHRRCSSSRASLPMSVH
jgi:hypothetical protein